MRNPVVPKTFVLVHGWGGSAAAWGAVAVALERAGHNVRAVALPGHEGSVVANEPTVAGAADAVGDVLSSVEEPAVLVGHSLGAQVTSLLHVSLAGRVEGEVVIDPAYGHPDDDLPRLHKWLARIRAQGHEPVIRFAEEAFSELTSPGLRGSVLRDITRTPVHVLASYLESAYIADGAIGMASQSRLFLARRTRPVLAVYSNVPGAIFERSLANKGVRVELWLGHGHWLHLEEPARFARLMSSWSDATLN